jgi:hypothetical protein
MRTRAIYCSSYKSFAGDGRRKKSSWIYEDHACLFVWVGGTMYYFDFGRTEIGIHLVWWTLKPFFE